MRHIRRIIPVFAALGFSLVAGSPASAQCNGAWDAPHAPYPGVLGTVNAVCTYDPDGGGPLPPLTVVGGAITGAGSTNASNIAAYDGTNWVTLGSGLNGTVNALAVFQNNLYAAGQFTLAGGVTVSNVAKWNGTAWSGVVGSGAVDGPNGPVCALQVYSNQLWVGGQFSSVNGLPVGNLARVVNGNWFTFSGYTADGAIRAMATDGTNLYFGGDFLNFLTPTNVPIPASRALKFNGVNAFTAMSTGFGATVRSLAWYGGSLYAGGDFVDVGGTAATDYVARWNGSSWVGIGTPNGPVHAMTVHNGELCVGGAFTEINGPSNFTRLARWNGSSWGAIGDYVSLSNGAVKALASTGTDLILGGTLQETKQGNFGPVAVWSAANWFREIGPGFSGLVNCQTMYGGDLVVGTQTGLVLQRTASGWQQIGAANNIIWALSVYNGDLIAAGQFTSINGVPAARIARWNGSTWQPLGTGMNSQVLALEVLNNELIAGGAFTSAGGASAVHVARWNGSAWAAIGAGLSGLSEVYALKSDGSRLWAGGAISGSPSCVASWGGFGWNYVESLGTSNSICQALAIFNGDVVAAGDFSGGVAYLTNSWQTLGTGIGSSVSALMVYNGQLFAAGTFTTAGGVSVANFARWDGFAWSAPGAGLNDGVRSLGTDGTDLILAGQFSSVGGRGAGGVAYWHSDAPVGIASNPSPESVCSAGPALFSVTASGPVQSYQWQRETAPGSNSFVNLPNGSSASFGGSANVGGATTQQLAVVGSPRLNAMDAVKYRCVVTGPCGSVTSGAALLTVCLADYDCNGFVNGDDFDSFVLEFYYGTAAADIDGNGFTNGDDFDQFVLAFEAGC